MNGEIKPRYDLSAACEHGEVVELLSPTAKPFNPDPIITELYTKLENFGDGDHIICIGNPILLSMSVAIAADINDGRVSLLQWHGRQERYIPVEMDLDFTSEAGQGS